MNHNTISGNPHDEDLRKLTIDGSQIKASELRKITIKNGMVDYFLKKFFEDAKRAANKGVNWLFFDITDKDIANLVKGHLEGLGYEINSVWDYNRGRRRTKIKW